MYALSEKSVTCARFLYDAVQADTVEALPGAGEERYDCWVALQAMRHMVALPVHYTHGMAQCEKGPGGDPQGVCSRAATHLWQFVCWGHVFIGDRTAHDHPGENVLHF